MNYCFYFSSFITKECLILLIYLISLFDIVYSLLFLLTRLIEQLIDVIVFKFIKA